MDTMESPIEPYPVYDAAGNVMKGGELDPEAQVISQEFKRPPY